MATEPELKKIPDSAYSIYNSTSNTTFSAPTIDMTSNMTSNNLKPFLLQKMGKTLEAAVKQSGTYSKRIKREYSDEYWRRGCIAQDEFPHHYYMKQHARCSICKARFHSKFECKEHKKRHHAY